MTLFGKKKQHEPENNPTEAVQEAEIISDEPEAEGEIYINDVEAEDNYDTRTNKFMIPEEDFGPFLQYVKDPDVTDIDYNGQDMWVTDVQNNKVKVTKEPLPKEFIERFVRRVANAKSLDFNQRNPVMEAETKELRISVVHNAIAVSGTSICIRKTPPFKRITESSSVRTGYTTVEVMSLLANCIKAHFNIIVAGQPHAGKTELAKFIGCYIPDSERVITVEDVMEWRFKQLKPKADCIEMQVNSAFDYTSAIIASLKQNPNWLMIAETRGREVASLINGFSTGVNGITTLHTDDVAKIPQRMLNMIDDSSTEQRMLGNIYEFVDLGLMVVIRKDPETGKRYRLLSQVAFFTYENGKPQTHLIVDNGQIIDRNLPESILNKFRIGGVKGDVFQNNIVDKRIRSQGDDPESLRELTKRGPVSPRCSVAPKSVPDQESKLQEDQTALAQKLSDPSGKTLVEPDVQGKERQPAGRPKIRQRERRSVQEISDNNDRVLDAAQ